MTSALFAAAHAALAAAWVTSLVVHARRRARGAHLLGLGGLALAWTLALFGWLRPEELPVEWLTVLQEGTGERSLLQLAGRAANVGPGFEWVTSLFHEPGVLPLRTLVHLNLWLWGLNALLFSALAGAILRSVGYTVLFALSFACNHAVGVAAFSELPATLLTTYFLVGLTGLLALRDGEPLTGRRRAAALGALALLTALVTLVRLEVSGVGLLSLLGLWGESRWPAPSRARLFARLGDWLRRPPGAARRRDLVLGGLVAFGFLGILLFPAFGSPPLGWLLNGLNPLNPAFVVLPVFLASLLPLFVVASALLGFWVLARGSLLALAFAVSVLVLVRTFESAAHTAPFERLRYGATFVPWCLVLALFGAEWLREQARLRGLSAALGWLVACTSLAFPGYHLTSLPLPEPALVPSLEDVALLSADPQREVRYLVRLVESHPGCVFHARVRSDFRHGSPAALRPVSFLSTGVYLGAGAAVGAGGGQGRGTAAGATACQIFYWGLDCNLEDGPGCAAEVAGATLLSEERFRSEPFHSAVAHGGRRGPQIRLAAYRLPSP